MPSTSDSSVPGGRLKEEVVPFTAGDGFSCNLVHVTGPEPPTKGPVLLVHGAGVRADIFRAPVRTTIVDYLAERGWDVWLENWRGSIDLEPNPWTLDQAALHDHPRAVDKVLEETGAPDVKAIIHCQGSTSFAMSAVAGLVPRVSTIVSNAVSLHPVVPRLSNFKLKVAIPLLDLVTDYLDPGWGLEADSVAGKATMLLVRLFHHECDNDVCKQVSLTYGSGRPALWSHENLNEETHEWLKGEFRKVSIPFFRQISRCVSEEHLVSVEDFPELPRSFVDGPPRTDARFALFAGEDNRCFLPESQERTFDHLSRHRPDRDSLHVLAGYGHLDVFMGKDAWKDVFPLIEDELERS